MWHAYGNAHIHANGDCDGNCHIHANGDCDSDIYCNGDCYSNCYSNGNGNSDCIAAAFTDATATAYTAEPSEHLLFREF